MSLALARPGQSITESYRYNSPYPNTPQTGRSGPSGLRVASTGVAKPSSFLIADPARSVRCAEKGLLRKEGEYWTIKYGGKALRLKDSKGLSHLARLLCSPGPDFQAPYFAGSTARPR